MAIIPNLQTTAMIIFFGTNLLICASANLIDSKAPAVQIESLTKPDSLQTLSAASNETYDIDPLPVSIFAIEVSDFLSPDIFSRANSFEFFIKKIMKLPKETLRKISYLVSTNLEEGKFPHLYIPYAQLGLWILRSLSQLEDIKESTRNIQRFAESNYPSTLPDIFTLDPIISPIFSSYVFSDNNPPVRLLRKSIEIPDNELPSVSSRVEKLLNHRRFPRLYSRFTKCFLRFVNNLFLLRRLKYYLDEICRQRKTITSIFHGENDLSNLQIDDEVDLQTEDSDSSAQLTRKPYNASTSTQLSQKIIANESDNDPDTSTSLSQSIKDEVRNFLSPDIFSQPDPFAYFLAKAMNSRNILRSTNYFLTYSLDHDEFPQRYIPYAELLSSLLSCLIKLDNIEPFIDNIRSYEKNRVLSSQQKRISSFDPELSKLFADDIFSKANPLAHVLIALMDLPDNEIPNVVTRLESLLMTKYLPPRYRRYGTFILTFLRDDYLLLRLKDNIDGIQRMITPNPSNSGQPDSIIAQE